MSCRPKNAASRRVERAAVSTNWPEVTVTETVPEGVDEYPA
jgi:hypothetical protein